MKNLLLITALAALSAFGQSTPESKTDVAQAKARLDVANKKKAEAEKLAADAEAEYRKLQGRIEPTSEEAQEMLQLFNQWQTEVIASRITLPEQFEAARKRSTENMQKLADQYKARLTALKQASNATNCDGLGPDQKWTACKDPAPVSGK